MLLKHRCITYNSLSDIISYSVHFFGKPLYFWYFKYVVLLILKYNLECRSFHLWYWCFHLERDLKTSSITASKSDPVSVRAVARIFRNDENILTSHQRPAWPDHNSLLYFHHLHVNKQKSRDYKDFVLFFDLFF